MNYKKLSSVLDSYPWTEDGRYVWAPTKDYAEQCVASRYGDVPCSVIESSQVNSKGEILYEVVFDSVVEDAKEVEAEYLIEIPTYNLQPSGLNDIITEIKECFDNAEAYTEEEYYDDDYLQYVVVCNEKEAEDFAKSFDGRVVKL